MAAATLPGVFCAALLHTRDVAASARHYQAVFGWAAVPDAAGTSFMLDGQRVASARDVVSGVDGWVPYVGVEDVDAGAALAARSGGTIFDGSPASSPGNRRLLRDPGGAVLGLCGLDDAAAVELIDEPGSVWWMEVLSHTPARARDFYGTLLQWQFTETPLPPLASYLVGRRGGTAVGGILPIGPGWGTSPRWQLLFRVEDLAWSTQQVVDAGGRVEFGPLDVPSAGVTTSVRDPHGALYVLMQPHPRTAA